MAEYQTHEAVTRQLYEEVSRLKAINAELVASIQKPVQADTSQIMSDGIKPNNSLVQAARQALEALERPRDQNSWYARACGDADAAKNLREALEAQEPWTPDDMAYRPGGLSQSAAAEQEPVAWKDGDTAALVNALRDVAVKYHATQQLRERIAELVRPLANVAASQPTAVAQEPVAWQYRLRPTWGGGKASWGPWEPCTKGQAEDCWKTPLLHDWAAEARPLYTAPQPTRQPLTDEQIQGIWCSAKIEGNQHGPFWFARAIERAHGIGGEA